MPDIAGAIKAFLEVAKDLFYWKTGGRTRDHNAIRSEIQHWREEYVKAVRGGDVQHATFCLIRMRKLRTQAQADSNR